jgi:hypothetical protein
MRRRAWNGWSTAWLGGRSCEGLGDHFLLVLRRTEDELPRG